MSKPVIPARTVQDDFEEWLSEDCGIHINMKHRGVDEYGFEGYNLADKSLQELVNVAYVAWCSAAITYAEGLETQEPVVLH